MYVVSVYQKERTINENLKIPILNGVFVAGTWQKAKKKELLSDRRPSSAQQPPV